MFTINLNKLQFFAHHGLHDEEAITGTNFEVDVSIQFDSASKVTSINDTINYVNVYEIVKKHMVHPVALLEVLAQNITEDICLLDNRIRLISIGIYKLHPPINNFIGNVGVTYSKVF
ncbi:MAG: dihydroneopterin aldolase [Ferruginibacter sp.]